MNKKKKIVFITGANRGIGKAIAQKLSNNNMFVIGSSTTKQGKNIINQTLEKNGIGIVLNIKNIYETLICIKKIHKKFGNIDILINNAVIYHDKLFINMNYKEWYDTVITNLNYIFYVSKLVVKSMIKKKFGRIITIGSVIGNIGNIGQINYSTFKSAIIGFNKTLALEVAKQGITANIIAPGIINTDMTKYLTKKQKKKFLSKIPLKKFGSPEDIASAVLFLSSNSASYITGQTIHINGGMYMN
ncbi:3-oxoacyl-ACP reductase FabG [Buchnera aphidicola]|uniref:3-oxoacyl-ACP reductase FabG n=1 Tax=Buchnera aphidicola TaxID=9 RepID=UPI0034643C9B